MVSKKWPAPQSKICEIKYLISDEITERCEFDAVAFDKARGISVCEIHTVVGQIYSEEY